jgi:methionine-gamma-lyase
MAAVSAIMYALADSGDEVAYIGPLRRHRCLLKQTFSRAGIKVTAYESDQDLLANIRPATKVVLFETLTNPTLKVVDPRVVVEAARKVGAITVCDNTFLTPICCVRSSLASTSSCTAAPSISAATATSSPGWWRVVMS